MPTDKNVKIAIVDDDPQMALMLDDFIMRTFPSAAVYDYNTGEAALGALAEAPDVIILDYHLDSIESGAMNGLEVLLKVKERYPKVPVIFLSHQENIEVAANTIRFGAYDYVVKNESAFHKIEIMLNNIFGQAALKKHLGAQKFFNRLLVVLLVVFIVGFLITWMKSM
jgi:two-component system, OmpR family, response regulator